MQKTTKAAVDMAKTMGTVIATAKVLLFRVALLTKG